jgi:2-polyprenyl-3-methyl-5-hydroxy-6-metoxy-1,4-benzoquinol methylase
VNTVAAAYDAIAESYDESVSGDRWMREILWFSYLRSFQPGDTVLDISCGTGIDSLFLASKGVEVVAIDISLGMIEQLDRKAAERGLADLIESKVMDAGQLADHHPRQFDGAVAAFAGANTLASLESFADDLSRLLRPGGRAVVHMLNRFSLWEAVGKAAKGDLHGAVKVGRATDRTFVIGGIPVVHRLYDPDEARRTFERHGLIVDRARGLGILRPPHTMNRIPRKAVSALDAVEARVRGLRWLRSMGRFFVLEMHQGNARSEMRHGRTP